MSSTRRLADEDLLEAALERGVLLDVLAELVERRRADEAKLAAGEHRLEHVARVHGRLPGGTGADDGVQLVDEGDDLPRGLLDLLEHGLEPLLELAAVLRPGDHRAEVERDESLAAQRLGDVAVDDPLGEALDDGGLADAGFADEHGVVLRAPAEHLHDAADLVVSPDDGVEPTLAGGGGEVGAVLLERLAALLRVLAGHGRAAAQLVEPSLERAGVALDRALLEQGEEEQVGREVGVTARGHEGRGVREHGERGLAQRGGGDGRAAAARHPGQHRAGGRGDGGRGRAGGLEQRGCRRAVLLGQGQRQVGRRDLGVAGGLGRALGDGERLGHLGGGLQLHEGLSSDEAGGKGIVGSNLGKVESIPLNPRARRDSDGGSRAPPPRPRHPPVADSGSTASAEVTSDGELGIRHPASARATAR